MVQEKDFRLSMLKMMQDIGNKLEAKMDYLQETLIKEIQDIKLKQEEIPNTLTEIKNSLNNNINSPQMFFNAKNKNYYIPKCLMFISLYPFFGEYEKILSQLYYYSLKEQVTIPIDKIIENLIIEIPVPPK